MGITLDSDLKIAILCPTSHGGGAENSMQYLHREFRSRKINSMFIAINKPFSEVPNFIDQRSQVNIGRNWNSGILELVTSWVKLFKVIYKFKPNKIIVNCELSELFIAILPTGVQEIYCVEHTSSPWKNKLLLGIAVRRVLKLKKVKWVAVSKTAGSSGGHGIDCPVIPNPIPELTKFRYPDRKSGSVKFRLLFIGRLSEEKRVSWCINVSAITGVTLEVFGDGPLRDSLENSNAITKSNIIFHGYISNVWQRIEKSNFTYILLAPSEYEGDGIVIASAIARQMPILLADNEDLRRFDLPEYCFCQNSIEMSEKIKIIRSQGFSKYQPSEQLSKKLRQDRAIGSIADRWISLILGNKVQ